MRHYLCIGVEALQCKDAFLLNPVLVNLAISGPCYDFLALDKALYIHRQIAVGNENYFLLRQTLYDLGGVRRSAADVRFRLHCRARVNICHNCRVRVLFLLGAQSFDVHHRCHWAARIWLGMHNNLAWVEDYRRFDHEIHAAENYDFRVCLLRLKAERQRVAYEIGNVLHLRALVVVREDDGVFLLFKARDLFRYRHITQNP